MEGWSNFSSAVLALSCSNLTLCRFCNHWLSPLLKVRIADGSVGDHSSYYYISWIRGSPGEKSIFMKVLSNGPGYRCGTAPSQWRPVNKSLILKATKFGVKVYFTVDWVDCFFIEALSFLPCVMNICGPKRIPSAGFQYSTVSLGGFER